ncbi:hypothetical protein BKA70DRAFT_1119330, partial [Coprinopsis sp. MPI-PUGE-AT-0042]
SAFSLFSSLGLYMPSSDDYPRDVRSKLVIVKTDTVAISQKTSESQWVRQTRWFQCQAGVDNESGRLASEKRLMAWSNVGCLYWVKLMTVHENKNGAAGRLLGIDSISGCFDHCAACTALTTMDRDPRIALHPTLREYALAMLRKNATLDQLRTECLLFSEKTWPGSPGDNQYRHRLEPYDTSALYRTISQERGIYQRTAAEENLDLWFRPKDPSPPSPLLAEACLHYQAHIEGVTDRFELIICTPHMREAAWKHGHNKQVLMDLTFKFCSADALLLILMVLDENGKGIPAGLIAFTAKKTAKAAHSDYDTVLITRLLQKYKEGLGRNADGEEIHFAIGNTDNDTRERKALMENFEGILLILCLFHTAQAWRNGLNRSLSAVTKGETRASVRKRLAKFVRQLLHDITDYDKAMQLYEDEKAHWTEEAKSRLELRQMKAKGALKFLKYLHSYMKSKELWVSWSKAGAEEAARKLGVPVSAIARTNNPLESFNGHFKGGYWEPYLHCGRLPRIDLWVRLTITDILPKFFEKRRLAAESRKYRDSMRTVAPENLPKDTPAVVVDHPAVEDWLQALENDNADDEGDVEIEGMVDDGTDASDIESVPRYILSFHGATPS